MACTLSAALVTPDVERDDAQVGEYRALSVIPLARSREGAHEACSAREYWVFQRCRQEERWEFLLHDASRFFEGRVERKPITFVFLLSSDTTR